MSHKLKKGQIENPEFKQVIATRAKSIFNWRYILLLILIVLILDGFLLLELMDRNPLLYDALLLWGYIQIPLVVFMALIVSYLYHKILWNNRNMDVHPIVLVEDDNILVRNTKKGKLYKLENITEIVFLNTGKADEANKSKNINGKVTFEYKNRKVCIGNIDDPERTARLLQDLVDISHK